MLEFVDMSTIFTCWSAKLFIFCIKVKVQYQFCEFCLSTSTSVGLVCTLHMYIVFCLGHALLANLNLE